MPKDIYGQKKARLMSYTENTASALDDWELTPAPVDPIDFYSKEDFPETEKQKDKKPELTKYTFSYRSFPSFKVAAYTIIKHIESRSSDKLVIQSKFTIGLQIDVDKYEDTLLFGQIAFSLKDNNKLISLITDAENMNVTVGANFDISQLIEDLKKAVKNDNPLRGKNIQLINQAGRGCDFVFKKVPAMTFDDVILEDKMKEDIKDNTIFQLKNVDTNNGIILHGVPGAGKSAVCQAIINEVINNGFSTCFIVESVDWTMLDEFIHSFLSPCVVIFEDVDSYTQSREDVVNTQLASFLQFLNGLTDHPEKLVFVATTNYIDHLDKAVKSRPVRFNRKFEFKHPEPEEIFKLVDLYFKDADLTDSQKSKCADKKFVGAHIKEIARTSELLSKKSNLPIKEVFDDAVELVSENFSTTLTKKVGF